MQLSRRRIFEGLEHYNDRPGPDVQSQAKEMTQLTIMLAFAAVMFAAHPVEPIQARNGTTARDFVVEPATLICLGFEWVIEGDENRNATVTVSYRATGQTAWKSALPLLRMGGEKIFRAPYTVPDGFCGQHSRPVTGHRV